MIYDYATHGPVLLKLPKRQHITPTQITSQHDVPSRVNNRSLIRPSSHAHTVIDNCRLNSIKNCVAWTMKTCWMIGLSRVPNAIPDRFPNIGP